MYFSIMPHNFPNFPTVYAQKQRERRITQKHSDLQSSYVPEDVAQAEFCATGNWVHLLSNIYIRGENRRVQGFGG